MSTIRPHANIRTVVRREVTVWLNCQPDGAGAETTVGELESYLEQLRARGAEDNTPVRTSFELNRRLTATIPLAEPAPSQPADGTAQPV